jgi:ankyrin repeat protein
MAFRFLLKAISGRFLWVVFQLAELCTAESDEGIQTILRHLPKDLGETYDRLLGRIVGSERQRLIKRMFQWIICARRPLTTEEICEGIAFTIDDDFWNVPKIPTSILRLVRACGNLIVIDEETRTLQMAHYTVQQYILHNSTSPDKFFHFDLQEAEELLGEVCIAYLNFSDFETQLVRYVDNGINAGMTAIEKVVTSSKNSGALAAMSVIHRIRGNKVEATNIDYSRYLTMKTTAPEDLLDGYQLLSYIRQNWLWHTAKFRPNGQVMKRRDVLFHNLVLEKQLPFSFRPWKTTSNAKLKLRYLEPLGWALVMDHCALILALMKIDPNFQPWNYIADAGEWFFEKSNIGRIVTSAEGIETTYPDPYNISKAMMDRLDPSTNDPWDPNLISAQAWLYSRMLSACRLGNLGVLQLCVPELITLTISFAKKPGSTLELPGHELEYFTCQIIAHLVMEAATSGQNETLNFFSSSSFKELKRSKLLTVTAFNGTAYNALEYAALNGNVVGVKTLFERGYRPVRLGSEAVLEYLDSAATEGQAEVVESLLTLLYLLPAYFSGSSSSTSIDLFKSCEKRSLALFLNAVSLGNLPVARIFESMGFDLLEPDADGKCPYTRAIREGNYNAVNYVLLEGRRKGDARGVRAIFDGLPLTAAAAAGALSIAKLLVHHGASEGNILSEPWTEDVLISTSGLYSRFNKIPIPRYTINLNAKDLVTFNYNAEQMSMSPTPLYAAAANGRKEMVKWLLSQGALPDFVSPTGLISWPATLGKPSIGLLASHIKLLYAPLPEHFTRSPFLFSGYPGSCSAPFNSIKSKVDVAYFQRPLAGAVLTGHTEIVNILLQAEVDVNQEDSNGVSAVYLAAAMGFSKIARLLLDAGAVFDKDHPWAANQLLACASDGKRTEALKLFLQLGVSPNTSGSDKTSALFRATSNGSLECMKILLRAGADPNDDNLHGKSLLFHACCQGSLEIARLLLQNGADVDSVYIDGRTPLFAACEKSHAPLVELLLSNGANPNYTIGSHLPFFEYVMEVYDLKHQREVKEYRLKFPIWTTPIMVASASGPDNIIDRLFKAGAEIEAKNEFGATALLCASAWGHEREARALIDAGASLFATDEKGRSVLNHACRGEHVTIVDFLLHRHYMGAPLFTDRDVQEASRVQS